MRQKEGLNNSDYTALLTDDPVQRASLLQAVEDHRPAPQLENIPWWGKNILRGETKEHLGEAKIY